MKKVLIANRSEIAVRVIRACQELGIKTVAVFSEADREALHVSMAEEALCIGPPKASDSYLNIPRILAAAELTGADAIHPGYGFLSENAQFAALCEHAGVIFIGPSSASIAFLGNKIQAKEVAKRVGCPVIPGSDGVVHSVGEGREIAEEIGYPILIKAVAGGGGRGIRRVDDPEAFPSQFAAARSEAKAGFHCEDVYIEKVIQNPRHIEVQMVGDHYGHYAYLFERDCTLQRRRQKLIEESPSPILTPHLRRVMGEAAVAIAQEVGYHSVGTVEFLLDADHRFYFMEVNTRIQVEHTVTEELTGIDLVRTQLLLAQHHQLPFQQEEIRTRGHVIQCRINAEDPQHHFSPSPGMLEQYITPGGPHIRIDSACYQGYRIPPYYDSMIAKVISRGADRDEAIAVMQRALCEFIIKGVKTTIPFHQHMLAHPDFRNHAYHIHYLDQLLTTAQV